eukprot:4659495-Amphidinium_carterae.1
MLCHERHMGGGRLRCWSVYGRCECSPHSLAPCNSRSTTQPPTLSQRLIVELPFPHNLALQSYHALTDARTTPCTLNSGPLESGLLFYCESLRYVV